jgi:IS30 family transposase
VSAQVGMLWVRGWWLMAVMGRTPLSRFVQEWLWAARQAGVPVDRAAAELGMSSQVARRWVAEAGGVPPRWSPGSGLRLSPAEREEIAVGLAAGESMAAIGRRIGRPACTVSREVARHRGRRGYRAGRAQFEAQLAARRPKPAKLAAGGRLRGQVERWLALRWSPQQISARLVRNYPGDPEMRVSHETIYQSLFVQSRGALRAELTGCLRTGRAVRRPRRSQDRRGRIAGKVLISERPAEAADRAVPGHWEGDLILGRGRKSAIGTLVERSSRLVLLLHLPRGAGPEAVRDAISDRITALPAALRRSLTWDQGLEMGQHRRFTADTGMQVYFCDPHAPWQRGTNENTNGLLRQFFPKGTDLAAHSRADLDYVEMLMNGRPRKTLGWQTPAEVMTALLHRGG